MLNAPAQAPPPPSFYYPPHPARFAGVLELPWFDTEEWKWRYAPARFVLPWPPRRVVTITILVVTLALYIASTIWARHPLFGMSSILFDLGILRYYIIDEGQVWRLATAIFLHANFAHWLENAIFLYLIGRVIEPTFGSWRMLATFMLGGIAATALTTTEVAGMTVGVGMSGSLYALIGAQIAHLHNNRDAIIDYDRRIRRNLALVGLLILSNGVIFLSGNRLAQQYGLSVDVLGHLGGFVAGYILTRMAGPLLRFSTTQRVTSDYRINVVVTDARPFTRAAFWRCAIPTAAFVAGVLIIERF